MLPFDELPPPLPFIVVKDGGGGGGLCSGPDMADDADERWLESC